MIRSSRAGGQAARGARIGTGGCAALVLAVLVATGCKPRDIGEAEAQRDVAWLATDGSAPAVAALGRLADNDAKALAALEARSTSDVNVYISAWGAVKRGASWGGTLLRAGLADPTRAELAASAMQRGDAQLAPFVTDLENAVLRLAAGRRGSVIAGLLASAGPPAHDAVFRRLEDAKTRGAMCDGIGLPAASADAQSTLLAVSAAGRDHTSCVATIMALAATDDKTLKWLATSAEPGLLTAAANGTLACPRIATIWNGALAERPPDAHPALAVPLQLSIRRCTTTLDPVIADLLARAPRARACIVQALDPFGGEIAQMRKTCTTLRQGWLRGESARVRERANDALTHGCALAR